MLRTPHRLLSLKKRPRARTIPVVAALLAGAGAAWLYGEPRRTGTFGPSAASPAYIVVDRPLLVTFTSQISDRRLKKRSVILVRLAPSGEPAEVLGRLADDGKAEDPVPHDGVYTFQTTLQELSVGKVNFKIAARFRPGKGGELELDDDDWDAELADVPREGGKAKKDKLSRLLRKLDRYTFSEAFDVTVDPLSLPPDPGEAGGQTLEGIDSDHDGVRDDVQRWIAYLPDETTVRAAVTQLVLAEQDFVSNAGREVEVLLQAVKARHAAHDCLEAIAGLEYLLSIAADAELQLLNTRERSVAYASSERTLPARVFFGSGRGKAACSFPVAP